MEEMCERSCFLLFLKAAFVPCFASLSLHNNCLRVIVCVCFPLYYTDRKLKTRARAGTHKKLALAIAFRYTHHHRSEEKLSSRSQRKREIEENYWSRKVRKKKEEEEEEEDEIALSRTLLL
jgi:hypothetical protein